MSFFKPLDVAKKEFRLINLKSRSSSTQPHSEDAPLQCTTFHAVHADQPEYQAVSYTWGDAPNKIAIFVDNQEVKITRNLRDVLLAIRKDDENLIIWVDALSINLEDDDEKNTQVQMMREIYSKAKNTISWLGPVSETSDLAMAKCNELGTKLCGNGTLPLMTRYVATKSGSDEFESLQTEVDRRLGLLLANAIRNLPATFVFLNAFQELLQRSYWQRMWIQQEFVVSPSISIRCGTWAVEVEHIYASFLYTILLKRYIIQHLMYKLQNSIAQGDSAGKNPDSFSYLETLQKYDITFASTLLEKRRRFQDLEERPHVEGMTLMDLLAETFVGVEVSPSLDRDRIYPLLGIASDTKSLGITSDYRKSTSVNSIYIQAARAMITAGHIDLLSLSQNRDRESGLPSWVPDWRDKIMRPSGGLPMDTPFAASGRHTFVPSEEQKNPHSHSISLKGYSIDVIEDLIPGWTPRPTASDDDWRDLDRYLRSVRNLCSISNSKLSNNGLDIYHTEADKDNGHIRIPIADQETTTEQFGVSSTQRATVESAKRYAHLEEHMRQHPNPVSPEAGTAHGIQAMTYITDMKNQVFRRPFITSKGYVGLVPDHAEAWDLLVVLRGGKFPYVLKAREDGTYGLIGDAYVHGIMYGEFVEEEPSAEEFVLR